MTRMCLIFPVLFSKGVLSQMLIDVLDLPVITVAFSEFSCALTLFTETVFKNVLKISYHVTRFLRVFMRCPVK